MEWTPVKMALPPLGLKQPGLWFILLGVMLFASGIRAGDYEEAVAGAGVIQWMRGGLEATGSGKTAERTAGGSLNWEKALGDAKLEAYEKMVKTIGKVRIQEETVIGEMMDDPAIRQRIVDMAGGSTLVRQVFTTDGRVDVTLNLSLYGGLSQLVLPSDIEHVELIQFPGGKPDASGRDPGEDTGQGGIPNAETYTGLVVDARGLGVLPALTLTLFNETGEEIYGPAFISRETAVQQGMCLYGTDSANAEKHSRVSPRPLVIRALRTWHVKGSDLVIGNADALILRSASEHLAFLRQCRVIVILDPRSEP